VLQSNPIMQICSLCLLLPILCLSAAAAGITVEVVDAQSAAIPNSTVRSVCRGRVTSTHTGPSGAAIPACPSALEVYISAPGFEPVHRRLEADATIELRPATLHTAIEVVVRDTSHDSAITGTAVEIDAAGARTVLDAVDRLVPGV
jgi:hypothetical protein